MTYRSGRLAVVTCGAAALSACASMSAVESRAPFKAETAFEVVPSTAWSRLPDALNPTTGSALTQDGVPLGAVYLISVENDKPMLDKSKRRNLPRYSVGSTALEQVDFLESSMALLGYANIATADLRPTMVDGRTGTRFDFAGRYPNGLELKGDAVMFEAEDQLNIVFYAAPSLHYYDKYKPDAEAIFDSVRLD